MKYLYFFFNACAVVGIMIMVYSMFVMSHDLTAGVMTFVKGYVATKIGDLYQHFNAAVINLMLPPRHLTDDELEDLEDNNLKPT